MTCEMGDNHSPKCRKLSLELRACKQGTMDALFSLAQTKQPATERGFHLLVGDAYS